MVNYIWLIVAVLAVVAEAMTVQMIAIWFAPAALAALALSACGASLAAQILTFIVVAAVCVATLYKKLRKSIKDKCEKTNLDAVVGAVAVVEEDIPAHGHGRVKLKGISWQATSKTDITAGSRVKVLGIDGVTLSCEPVSEYAEIK